MSMISVLPTMVLWGSKCGLADRLVVSEGVALSAISVHRDCVMGTYLYPIMECKVLGHVHCEIPVMVGPENTGQ